MVGVVEKRLRTTEFNNKLQMATILKNKKSPLPSFFAKIRTRNTTLLGLQRAKLLVF